MCTDAYIMYASPTGYAQLIQSKINTHHTHTQSRQQHNTHLLMRTEGKATVSILLALDNKGFMQRRGEHTSRWQNNQSAATNVVKNQLIYKSIVLAWMHIKHAQNKCSTNKSVKLYLTCGTAY